MNIKFYLAFLFSFLVLSKSLIAQPPHTSRKSDPDKDAICKQTPYAMDKNKIGIGGILHLSEELNLTGEQIEKIRKIQGDSKKETSNLRKEIKKSMDALQEEFKKSKSDKDKINNLINKISDNQKRLMLIRSEQMLKIKEILTEKQFKELIKIFETHKKTFKKRFMKKFKNE